MARLDCIPSRQGQAQFLECPANLVNPFRFLLQSDPALHHSMTPDSVYYFEWPLPQQQAKIALRQRRNVVPLH